MSLTYSLGFESIETEVGDADDFVEPYMKSNEFSVVVEDTSFVLRSLVKAGLTNFLAFTASGTLTWLEVAAFAPYIRSSMTLNSSLVFAEELGRTKGGPLLDAPFPTSAAILALTRFDSGRFAFWTFALTSLGPSGLTLWTFGLTNFGPSTLALTIFGLTSFGPSTCSLTIFGLTNFGSSEAGGWDMGTALTSRCSCSSTGASDRV
mmetsp:Transcript_22611/g.56012  ORF Transcript_22611/g.56012 Transcript_22611/m.56012 type:complete len:206 (+) Transcript_22611:803-1420(+)